MYMEFFMQLATCLKYIGQGFPNASNTTIIIGAYIFIYFFSYVYIAKCDSHYFGKGLPLKKINEVNRLSISMQPVVDYMFH